MDIIHKSIKALLILIPGICLAITDTQFWVSTGYDFSTQAFSIDSKILPDQVLMEIPPVDTIPLTIDESGIFMAVEAEKCLSPSVSGSVKFIFFHPEKSAFKPLLSHTSGTMLEAYGKYHYNQFSYLLGYSVQHDSIIMRNLSASFKSEYSRIISSFVAGAELFLSPNTRLSFSTLTTIPFFDNINNAPITPHAKYNVRIALAYNLDSLQ